MSEHEFSRVAVLKGGVSSERGISLKSGAAIAQGLRDGGYDVTEIDIQSEDFQIPDGIDAVFVALHGRFGEDGGIQRKLVEMKVPFTGSSAESSRISFDKILTRKVLEQHGVPVAPGEVVTTLEGWKTEVPLVVKPPREGSSVGCHLVFDEADREGAFADARRFSDEVLVETYIPGRELTVGVVNGQVLPVVEIIPESEWYDFEAKYVTGDTRYVCPAELGAEITTELQTLALRTFRALGADTFGRVDFRLSSENRPYVLELNAIPGFTATSLLPKAAEVAGIGFSELCCSIMERAHL
ncbi:D-alanine--D-alanine ligase [Verrucomicrobia bacterium S94]|nr:D-alanine--D-alanine ligase [Verrucomicrobia bacterium S94]